MKNPTQDASRPVVHVTAPARLHMGFVDLEGGLGRRFGSVGLALNEPVTRVSVRRASRMAAHGPRAERALDYATRMLAALALPGAVDVQVDEAIPAHAGLGSGTQLALAVGMAIATAHEQGLSAREVATHLDRGARSGIGLSAFESGGFLIDGGRGARDAPPPLICRHRVPARWRVLLIFDGEHEGVHGSRETAAFAELPAFTPQAAGEACRLVLMQALPALAEGDIGAFGAALTALQQRMGEHFACAQGGRFTSPRVGALASWLAANGAAGAGQSSWGPTGFALCEDEASGRRLVQAAARRVGDETGLTLRLCRPRNEPGTICMGEVPVAGCATQ